MPVIKTSHSEIDISFNSKDEYDFLMKTFYLVYDKRFRSYNIMKQISIEIYNLNAGSFDKNCIKQKIKLTSKLRKI